jgi:hypothetical protein
MVKDIARLPFIPPLQEGSFHANLLQSCSGLFDLNLGPPMGEHERNMAVEEDFHT